MPCVPWGVFGSVRLHEVFNIEVIQSVPGRWRLPGALGCSRRHLQTQLLSAIQFLWLQQLHRYEWVINVYLTHSRGSVLPVLRVSLRWLGNLASPWASWELRHPVPRTYTQIRTKGKRDNETQGPPSEEREGHLKGGGVIVHQCPVMSMWLVSEHYWTGLVVLPCCSRGESP